MIRTSVNISDEVFQRLQKSAEQKGVKIEDIIVPLLRYFSKRMKHELIEGKAVRYQERGKMRKCLQVTWFDGEYEFLIDLRKVHKKSVSRLIAEAVLTFIDKKGLFNDHIWHNYKAHRYYMLKFNKHNYIGCIFMWEYVQKNTC